LLDISAFLRIVVDPVRLAVLGAAAVGPVDSASIAAATGVTPRRVQREIGGLTQAGLLVDGRLDTALLQRLAAQMPRVPEADPAVIEGPWTADESRVLQTFFSGDRLTEIPAAQGKRRVVLERLAMEFEPGVRYREQEVNFTLQLFHPDYAALRRYLVDEGIMTRAEGVYWRTGGRYRDET
jgi:hypothetical protein